MKLRSCLLLLVAMCAKSLSAQVSLGVNVFYNQTWQKFNLTHFEADDPQCLHKFGMSVAVQYDIDRHFSLLAEPGIVRLGDPNESRFIPFFLPMEVSFVGTYLEMPVLLQGRLFAWQDRVQFFAQAGLGYAYLLNAHSQSHMLHDASFSERREVVFEDNPSINRLDFGYYCGGGFGVRSGPGYLTATFRYYNGMAEVNDAWKSRNRSLSFMLGYRLSLGQ